MIAIKVLDCAIILNTISTTCFFLYCAYAIYCNSKKKITKGKKTSLLIIAIIFISTFAFEYASRIYIFHETIVTLRESTTKVLLDGVNVNLGEQFAVAFENRVYFKKSGSRPIKNALVKVIGTNFSITYLFRQDSRDKNLYWVYIPESKIRRDFSFVKISL